MTCFPPPGTPMPSPPRTRYPAAWLVIWVNQSTGQISDAGIYSSEHLTVRLDSDTPIGLLSQSGYDYADAYPKLVEHVKNDSRFAFVRRMKTWRLQQQRDREIANGTFGKVVAKPRRVHP